MYFADHPQDMELEMAIERAALARHRRIIAKTIATTSDLIVSAHKTIGEPRALIAAADGKLVWK